MNEGINDGSILDGGDRQKKLPRVGEDERHGKTQNQENGKMEGKD